MPTQPTQREERTYSSPGAPEGHVTFRVEQDTGHYLCECSARLVGRAALARHQTLFCLLGNKPPPYPAPPVVVSSPVASQYGPRTLVEEALDLLGKLRLTEQDYQEIALECLDQAGVSANQQNVIKHHLRWP